MTLQKKSTKNKKTEELLHDFMNGKGATPAHQHINQNGWKGGWVENTAEVHSTVTVGENAQVADNARVLGNTGVYNKARILGNVVVQNSAISGNAHLFGSAHISDAVIGGDTSIFELAVIDNASVFGMTKIFGRAKVFGDSEIYDSWIFDNAQISGGAKVYNAFIFGNALIESDKDYLVMGPLGSDNIFLTVTFRPDVQIASGGRFKYKFEDFSKGINELAIENPLGDDYDLTVSFIQKLQRTRR